MDSIQHRPPIALLARTVPLVGPLLSLWFGAARRPAVRHQCDALNDAVLSQWSLLSGAIINVRHRNGRLKEFGNRERNNTCGHNQTRQLPVEIKYISNLTRFVSLREDS